MASAVRGGTHVPPYTADGRSDSVGPLSDPSYAVGNDPSGFVDYAGWAPTNKETQESSRSEDILRHDRRANLRNPWGWWRKLDADTAARHSVEFVDANGHEEAKGQRTRAADPRWTPVPESRPTQQMSPHTYVFTRPFDQDVARRFTGDHMSLANNRRNYDILTMAPAPNLRNTYRTEPTPWDTDIVDEAPDVNAGRPSQRLAVPNIPPGVTNRSFRLG